MTVVAFQKATKKQSRLRMAIDGPSGSGKTYTALTFAQALANGGRVAVIDTERGSASKYADLWAFDVLELETYDPRQYVEGIEAAEAAGYDVLVIDSLSHAWEGARGVLELHDDATKRDRAGNSYTAWKDVTPIHRKMVDAILQSRCHIIATMRSKTEYVLVTDDRGKTAPKKVGMAPVQRQGMEYEFDVVADMDIDHNLVVSKSRCPAVADAVVNKPTAAWFATLAAWLKDGAPEIKQPQPEHVIVGEEGERVVVKAPKAPSPTTGIARPASPHVVRGWLRAKAQKYATQGATCTGGQRGAMCGAVEALFESDQPVVRVEKRHSLLRYFWEVDSSAKLTPSQILATASWAQEKLDTGEYVPDANAVQEAAKIIEQDLLAKGQQPLSQAQRDNAPPSEGTKQGLGAPGLPF